MHLHLEGRKGNEGRRLGVEGRNRERKIGRAGGKVGNNALKKQGNLFHWLRGIRCPCAYRLCKLIIALRTTAITRFGRGFVLAPTSCLDYINIGTCNVIFTILTRTFRGILNGQNSATRMSGPMAAISPTKEKGPSSRYRLLKTAFISALWLGWVAAIISLKLYSS